MSKKPEPSDKELYDRIKQEVYNEYPKHSIYRSMMIVKRYKDAGGKYKEKRPSLSSTKQWLNDKWISANDWLHNKELIQCGNTDTMRKYNEYPLCYTKKRLMTFTDEELRALIKNKNILHSKHLMTKRMTGKGCCSECDKKHKKGKGILDTAKSLYGKAKEKAEMCRVNPVGCAFGFNYCAPFTKLEGQAPTNDVDKICLTHDYDYNRIDRMKREGVDKSILEDEVRKADEKMLDALKYIPDSQQKTMGYKLAKYGIFGKTQLEDMGLLPKTMFSGGSIHNEDFEELQGELLRIRHPNLIPINKKYGGFIGQIIGQIIPQVFSKMASKGIEAIKKDPMKIVNLLSGGAIDLNRLKMFV